MKSWGKKKKSDSSTASGSTRGTNRGRSAKSGNSAASASQTAATSNNNNNSDSPTSSYQQFQDEVPAWLQQESGAVNSSNQARAGGGGGGNAFFDHSKESPTKTYRRESSGNGSGSVGGHGSHRSKQNRRKHQNLHERTDSGSFSQSEDFRSIFDSKNEPLKPNGSDEGEEEDIYIVKQKYGYFSILFSVGQVAVLIIMMAQCGVAPININPMFGPYPDALSEWGGKNAFNILEEHEWWRLITPIMLHAGVIHLLCNIAVQLETGAFFEREWGSTNWLIIYLTSALGSSVLSVIAMPDAISVGSSGAVMGLFGGKLAEVICRCCESDKTEQGRIGHQVRKEQCAGVTCSVVVVMLFSFIPYVDWAAHLGGLLAGLVVGVMVFSLKIKTLTWRLAWFIVGTALTGLFFGISLFAMYNGDIDVADELEDVCGYYKENFDNYECNCMRDQQQDR
uniref:rhomboid protease n=1 Tax=Craspedostauros australis TaxID=1486917 RepID=A0A6T6G4P5_9STRA|mmetsp:Transcript_2122/g.5879  ORF Transcript_2122/g.5879 Transcript_2122/m.5879 type:complete len:451 (+) Transcript_2122:135-1487(+)